MYRRQRVANIMKLHVYVITEWITDNEMYFMNELYLHSINILHYEFFWCINDADSMYTLLQTMVTIGGHYLASQGNEMTELTWFYYPIPTLLTWFIIIFFSKSH